MITLWGAFDRFFGKTFRIKQNIGENRVFCLLFLPLRVLRCREFLRTYGKTRFSAVYLTFIRHFESFLALLFYSKRKVQIISDQMSTVGASYDKTSLLWLLQSFDEKQIFGRKINFIRKKSIFRKILFFIETLQEPQKRGFVVWSSYGTHLIRNYLYFAFRIK